MIPIWTICNGFDITDYIPKETLLPVAYAGDQLPQCDFDVVDIESQLSFDTGMEVIIFNENAPKQPGLSSPTIPAHNLCVGIPNSTYWTQSGTLGSLVTPSGVLYQMTFSNNAVGSGFIQFQSFYGYIHPGQQYMFSVYINVTTPLTNAQGILQMQWLDAGSNPLGSPITLTFSTATSNQHMNISGTAPTGAVYVLVQMGGQTTNTTNSGRITFGAPQCEPMWFVNRGISYPTPDINAAQVLCSLMPDLTVSRSCRLFAGYIEDIQIDHTGVDYAEGPSRTWHLQVAGLGSILENTTYTGAFDGQYDSQIIQSVVSSNGLSSWINVVNAPNTSSPVPVIQGVLVDSISFNENTLRDILNSLTAMSGFLYYLDWYGTLYYIPAYYGAAPFVLTDAQPDNITYYSYYDFHYEKDASQQKWDIKIIGGKFLEAVIQDSFTGNGSTTTFNLSQQPYNIHNTTVNGSLIKVGVRKRDTFTGGITALYNKAAKQLIFQTAPASGAAIVVQYTFEAPVVTRVIDTSINKPVSPAYALPPFQSKVHDTNIVSTAAATTRGLQELNTYAKAKETITLKCQQYAYVGQIIYITATKENIINQPYVVQEVDSSYLGNGINEFAYTLGYYRPRFTDHSRNIHKATHRSTTTAAVDVDLQLDLLISEFSNWSETVTATPIATNLPPLIWNTGKYGLNSWGWGVYQTTVLADAPIRYYRLNETSGTVAHDIGSQAVNGTINGGVTLAQAGLLFNDPTDASMLFNGTTGYVSAAATGMPSGAQPWTMEAWVKIPSSSGNFPPVMTFGNTTTGISLALMLYIASTNKLILGDNNGAVCSSAALTPGSVHHVVGVYDGTNASLFLDGSLVAGPTAHTWNIALSSGFVDIGADNEGDFWASLIQEAAWYSVALSSSRIFAHYMAGIA